MTTHKDFIPTSNELLFGDQLYELLMEHNLLFECSSTTKYKHIIALLIYLRVIKTTPISSKSDTDSPYINGVSKCDKITNKLLIKELKQYSLNKKILNTIV